MKPQLGEQVVLSRSINAHVFTLKLLGCLMFSSCFRQIGLVGSVLGNKIGLAKMLKKYNRLQAQRGN